jgi:UDP-N-acetylmuramyl pentapeptide phosphotransferase/UDP-N-acetylglucosamine-1-phosphate transferase
MTLNHLLWIPPLAGLLASVLTVALLLWANTHLQWGLDKGSGVQKFHTKTTSRLGGVAIFTGILMGLWGSYAYFPKDGWLGTWVMVASAPVFIGGLVEDLTHKVSPAARLWLAIASSAVVYTVFQLGVKRTDIFVIDAVLSLPFAAFLLTVLVVAGFVNAINIIDGFHGLAAGSVIAFLAGIAGLAWICNDGLVFRLCLVTAGATLGFLVWNWPWGKIFLGDGGAYLLGFWVVVLGLMVPHRSPEISPMAPVLVGIYPLVETVYSMYRRKFVRTHPINHPDALHLHTLIYRRLVLRPGLHHSAGDKNAANAKVALYGFAMAAVPAALACVFIDNTNALLLCMALFALFYIDFYRRIVRFRTPLWLLDKTRR